MNLENIPTYLKEHISWCVWKKEMRKQGMTKVPYNPKTGNHANVKNPSTLTDYESAVAAMKYYDGIGIRVSGRLIAIDLDHCIEDGKLLPWAAEIIAHLKKYIRRDKP